MTAQYVSKQRVDSLEAKVENLVKALENQTRLIVEMRETLLPVPIEVLMRERTTGASPAVRISQYRG